MKRLKQLLDQLTLLYQIEVASADVLDNHDLKIQELEAKLVAANSKAASLEKRYSELLMIMKEIRRKLDSRQ